MIPDSPAPSDDYLLGFIDKHKYISAAPSSLSSWVSEKHPEIKLTRNRRMSYKLISKYVTQTYKPVAHSDRNCCIQKSLAHSPTMSGADESVVQGRGRLALSGRLTQFRDESQAANSHPQFSFLNHFLPTVLLLHRKERPVTQS